MSKYVIIDAEAIQKRIEELEEEYKSEPAYQFNTYGDKLIKEIMILKQILSQSTPLIPEIEKTFDNGFHKGYNVGQADAQSHPLALTIANHIHKDRQKYISNLKLDI